MILWWNIQKITLSRIIKIIDYLHIFFLLFCHFPDFHSSPCLKVFFTFYFEFLCWVYTHILNLTFWPLWVFFTTSDEDSKAALPQPPQAQHTHDPLRFAYQTDAGVEAAVLYLLHWAHLYLEKEKGAVRILFLDFVPLTCTCRLSDKLC